MRLLLSLWVAMGLVCPALGQYGFTNVSASQGIDVINPNPVWGSGVSFYDFDHDGWDDLSFPVKNDSLAFFRNVNGNFTPWPSFGESTGEPKQILWFDMDNDGDSDVLITYYLSQSLLYRNDGDWNFTNITEAAGIPSHPIAKTFGAACADYDKDGFLDIYLSNYNWISGPANWLLHNEGDGTFTEVAQALGVSNGQMPTFQVSWLDYNHDTWPDIYIINDKAPANALYKNNGDGTFTDVSVSSGANVVVDAMCNSICDFDNNGTLDIYITNSNWGNVLLSNQGDGTFEDVALEANMLVEALSWGTLWIDYNNDSWDDAHVLTTYTPIQNRNPFFVNQQDGTFSDQTIEVGLYQDTPLSYSNAKGDFNNDGYSDMAVSNTQPNTCFLYQNNGGDNHWVKVRLQGSVSNRDAVGTWMEYYFSGHHHVEYTMQGENYLGQDSQAEILGLGEATHIDSILITWPSGLQETYYSIPHQADILLVEGATLSNSISYEGEAGFCAGDSLVLDAGSGYLAYQWSTGDTTQFLTLSYPATVWVEVLDTLGFNIHSEAVSITAWDYTAVSPEFGSPTCSGASDGEVWITKLDGPPLLEVVWSTGDSTFTVAGLEAGSYDFMVQNVFGCTTFGTVEITQPDALCADVSVDDVSCQGLNNGLALVTPCGGTPGYSIDWGELNPNALPAGFYEVQILDSLGCSLSLNLEINEPDALSGSLTITPVIGSEPGNAEVEIQGGTLPYEVLWSTNGTGTQSGDLEPGTYGVTVTDAHGCTWNDTFEIGTIDALPHLANAVITAYPNPTDSDFRLTGLNAGTSYTLSVWDVRGKMLDKKVIFNSETTVISMSEHAAGYYVVRLCANDAEYMWKVAVTNQ
ncbi:MAG: VCBS repeat-containing protein [Flavobacteriales bacterium]|nr:VCBS repeat-containing protein [Flavobacteriales bacterium]